MFEFLKKKTSSNKPQPVTMVFMAILLLLVLVQMVQFYRFRHRVQFIDDLEANNTQVIEELGLAQEYLTEFGTDLNQIRSFLLLPTKDYSFGKSGEESEILEEDMNTLVFDFVTELGSYEQNKALYATNLTAVQAWILESGWSAGVELEEGVQFDLVDSETQQTVASLLLGYDGQFSATSYDGSFKMEKSSEFSAFEREWATFEAEGLSDLLANVKTLTDKKTWLETQLLTSESLSTVLMEKGLRSTPTGEEDEAYFYYSFQNSDLDVLAELRLFKSDASLHLFTFGEEAKEQSLEEAKALESLVAALKDLDTRTEGKRRFEENQKQLVTIFEDRAFNVLLENAGLSIGDSYETTDRVYYPLLNAKGEELRAFELDKNTGELKVKTKEGEAQTLTMATQELQSTSKKKTFYCPGTCLSTLV